MKLLNLLNTQLSTLEIIVIAIIMILIILVVGLKSTLEDYIKTRKEVKVLELQHEKEMAELEYKYGGNDEFIDSLSSDIDNLNDRLQYHVEQTNQELQDVLTRLERLELKNDGIKNPKLDIDEENDLLKLDDKN